MKKIRRSVSMSFSLEEMEKLILASKRMGLKNSHFCKMVAMKEIMKVNTEQ